MIYNRDKLGRFTSKNKEVGPKRKTVSAKKTNTKSKIGTQADYILLDRSGSMAKMMEEALTSINGYSEQLKDSKVDTNITLIAFDKNTNHNTSYFDPRANLFKNIDDDFKVIRDKVKPSNWKKIQLNEVSPRGMTPLYDAVAKLISLANEVKYDKVAIIIMTDGHENASTEFNVHQVKTLLDECRAKNWQIIFLGADFDNATQASSLGNSARNTVSVARGKLGETMAFTAEARSLYAATGASMDYTEELKKMVSKK